MSAIDDELSGDEELNSEKQKNPKKKKMIMIIIVALIIIIGGVFGVLVVSGKDGKTSEDGYTVVEVTSTDTGSSEGESGAASKDKKQTETLVLYDLPEVNVQIGDILTGTGNLKLSMNIEISKTEDLKRIEALMPKILDAIISHTTELSYDEIKGAKGLYFLREELLFRINIITDPVKVYNLNFKNIELIR